MGETDCRVFKLLVFDYTDNIAYYLTKYYSIKVNSKQTHLDAYPYIRIFLNQEYFNCNLFKMTIM